MCCRSGVTNDVAVEADGAPPATSDAATMVTTLPYVVDVGVGVGAGAGVGMGVGVGVDVGVGNRHSTLTSAEAAGPSTVNILTSIGLLLHLSQVRA